jgi:integrase
VGENGRIRREVAGTKANAINLYRMRKAAILEGRKLPHLRARVAPFSELCDDYIAHVKNVNEGWRTDAQRGERFKVALGHLPAEMPIAEVRKYFGSQDWSAGTCNREKTCLRSIFKLAIENGKIASNPAALLKRKREPEGRVRWLTAEEEQRLRAAINERCPEQLPAFLIALHTGMRRSEQYRRINWSCVDLLKKDLFVPMSKSGRSRHIPLNAVALSAFASLRTLTSGVDPIFASTRRKGKQLVGTKHWFDAAVDAAKVPDFTWHCLRHSFASRLAMAGVDLRTIADLMGHATAQMAMKYSHLAPEHRASAVAKIESSPSPDILLTPQAMERTDTKTDTGEKERRFARRENVQ